MNVCCRLKIYITNGYALQTLVHLSLIPTHKSKSNDVLPQNKLSIVWESTVNIHGHLRLQHHHLAFILISAIV